MASYLFEMVRNPGTLANADRARDSNKNQIKRRGGEWHYCAMLHSHFDP